MKKSFVKILCLIVSILLFITVFAGCSKDEQTAQPGETSQNTKQPEETGGTEKDSPDEQNGSEGTSTSSLPIAKEKITLKVMAPKHPMGGPWENLRIFKDLEEMTNIHLEFDVAYEGFEEKKNLALATGDLPDIFLGALTAEDEEIYGPQGVLIDLTDLIEQHGVNIKKAFEKYPLLKKTITASDGKIYALGRVIKTPTMGSYKPVINKVWLENLGLEVPETIDELYNVLKAFKEGDPNKNGQQDEIPLGEIDFGILGGMLLPAFGEMAQDIALKDGKVVFTPITEGYKHYLEFLHKLYQEKLIDPMFMSQSMDEYLAKTKQNLYGVLGHIRQADWQQYQILSPLTSQYNSERFSSSSDVAYASGAFAITKVNKYPVESIKWADLFFTESDEGVNGITGVALWIGRRGVDWDFTEDGSAIRYLFEPEEGMTEIQTLLQKVTPSETGLVGTCVLEKPFESPYLRWVGESNMRYIFPYIRPERIYPNVRFTSEEQEKLSIMKADITNFVSQSRARFITGEDSLDKWDEYVKTLKDMGIDEYISIHQTAYDRFMQSGN